VTPLHAASGAGYGQGRAGNSHRHVPGGWLPTVRYLVEEHGLDVNARDHFGYTPLHHAASRGDMDVIRYLVDRGADPTAVARSGQTTADMANGPVQRIQPHPEARDYLVSLGAINNDNCRSC
jgi:ankyrin repeat protein